MPLAAASKCDWQPVVIVPLWEKVLRPHPEGVGNDDLHARVALLPYRVKRGTPDAGIKSQIGAREPFKAQLIDNPRGPFFWARQNPLSTGVNNYSHERKVVHDNENVNMFMRIYPYYKTSVGLPCVAPNKRQ